MRGRDEKLGQGNRGRRGNTARYHTKDAPTRHAGHRKCSNSTQPTCVVSNPTPSNAFRLLPDLPNSAVNGYATEGALFVSQQLYADAVIALRKVCGSVKG